MQLFFPQKKQRHGRNSTLLTARATAMTGAAMRKCF